MIVERDMSAEAGLPVDGTPSWQVRRNLAGTTGLPSNTCRSRPSPDQSAVAGLSVDEDGLGWAELQSRVRDLGCAVLCSANPVRQQADVDMVSDHTVVGDGVRSGVGQVSAGGGGQFFFVDRGQIGRMKLRSVHSHDLGGHVPVGGVDDDSFGVGAQGIARVGAVEGKALVRVQYPSSDDVVAQFSCGERGHVLLMSFPCKWCSYRVAAASCAMSDSAVTAVSNGSGLRSARLTMSAPSMLVTVLSASALADS